MTHNLHRCLTCFLLFLSFSVSAQDPLLDILQKELTREFDELKKQEIPPYFISYKVGDRTSIDIAGSFGCLERVNTSSSRFLATQIRVGSPDLDNFHEMKGTNAMTMMSRPQLPVENNEDAIRQVLWQTTNENYYQAIQKLTQIKGNLAVNVPDEDKSPDFSSGVPVQSCDPQMKTTLDKGVEEKLINKVRLYSKAFARSKDLTSSSVRFQIVFARDYFVSTEGSKIAENHPSINLFVSANVLAEDGMDLSLYKTYYLTDLKDLPKDETVVSQINAMVKKLEDLKQSPVVDPYSGPALFSGEATGVFFHEIFGHRVEAARMKSENDAQTFKNKVGQQVLNKNISVIFDPTLSTYKGFRLSGSYQYDDEGTQAQRVVVVDKGVLSGFLTNRTPIKGFENSNGHGRGQIGMTPVARQSNLIVESDQVLSEADLRKLFVEELKKQNLEFGYYFKVVSGGFTMTNRIMPNAFNVTPLEVYKVYVDGKADELVRGINLVGTPLAMFSEIEAVGGELGQFVGTCGAESGGVPVSSVCPMMMVKKIEIQKKQKSGNSKPILDRPF
ncbi:MAG TPA: TldD/PmbA family protein [Prolixibacteraceae bacterium]|nr:TldD/PmbA family protein [Prolixibacteraceae bacterium]